jgi:hypothetical protein
VASGIISGDVRTSSTVSELGAWPELASEEVCDEEPYNNNDQIQYPEMLRVGMVLT